MERELVWVPQPPAVAVRERWWEYPRYGLPTSAADPTDVLRQIAAEHAPPAPAEGDTAAEQSPPLRVAVADDSAAAAASATPAASAASLLSPRMKVKAPPSPGVLSTVASDCEEAVHVETPDREQREAAMDDIVRRIREITEQDGGEEEEDEEGAGAGAPPASASAPSSFDDILHSDGLDEGARTALARVALQTKLAAAQTELLSKLSDETGYILHVKQVAAGILAEKRRDQAGDDGSGKLTPAAATAAQLSLQQRESAILSRSVERGPPPPALRPPLTPVDWARVLQGQREGLAGLHRSDKEYQVFLSDCVDMQQSMQEDKELLELLRKDEERLQSGRRSSADEAGDIKYGDLLRIADPSAFASDGGGASARGTLHAEQFKKARRALVRQFYRVHHEEQALIARLAQIIELLPSAEQARDPREARPRAEPWLFSERVPREFCVDADAARRWLVRLGGVDPAEIVADSFGRSLLLRAPTDESHAANARVLIGLHNLPTSVHEVYPCGRCYAAPSTWVCDDCSAKYCQYCCRAVHNAQSKKGHRCEHKPQLRDLGVGASVPVGSSAPARAEHVAAALRARDHANRFSQGYRPAGQ